MLLVIFGAGASYDSFDAKPPGVQHLGWSIDEDHRPPLANDLFGSRSLFAEAMIQFDRLQPIVPLLRGTGGKNIEAVLQEFQAEADKYPERLRQLMSVRYYLHYVLWECQDRWKADTKYVTNYKALLDQINRWRKPNEAVCLVTFNYDTLLEDAMALVGPPILNMNDYASRRAAFKIFKLHGSVNWARVIEAPMPYGEINPWAVVRSNIEHAAGIKITDTFTLIQSRPCGLTANHIGLIPAIAIPVESKNLFECPQSHLGELERLLPDVDKLLLIGWRAKENHFLQLLTNHLKSPLVIQIVAGTEVDARAIATDLTEGALSKLQVRWEFSPGGFTDFIVNRRVYRILSYPEPG